MTHYVEPSARATKESLFLSSFLFKMKREGCIDSSVLKLLVAVRMARSPTADGEQNPAKDGQQG